MECIDDGFVGFEFSLDFHPFNFTKLLPEEISAEKRKQIKQAAHDGGIRISIHSPIVGPYAPHPSPGRGKQLFYNPAQSMIVQKESIDFAGDIGATAIVFHLIGSNDTKTLSELVEYAVGTDVRVSIENYCHTPEKQTSDFFIKCMEEISSLVSPRARKQNLGVTLDVGHYNIEGDDPIVASRKVGQWCMENNVPVLVHATDNYGDLLFSPPAYSADVHANVAGRGINNDLIIKLLRSQGLQFDVVAEQIQPLSLKDIDHIHDAQSYGARSAGGTSVMMPRFKDFVDKGKTLLMKTGAGGFIGKEVIAEASFCFIAGLLGVQGLKEYIFSRKLQDKKNVSVDDAKKMSEEFLEMSKENKADLIAHIDELLLPAQSGTGSIHKNEKDIVCQNISGAIFNSIDKKDIALVFSRKENLKKGDCIAAMGDSGEEMFMTLDGEVEVKKEKKRLAILEPGSVFGEMALFYNTKRPATFVVHSQTAEIGVLSRTELEQIFLNGEKFAQGFIDRLLRMLPGRQRSLNENYKAAINALHFLADGTKKDLPAIKKTKIGKALNKRMLNLLMSVEDKKYKEVVFDKPDMVVFREGDQGDGAYCILEGKVKVVASLEGGGESKGILLGQQEKGEIFGEMALIDGMPRSATIVTLSPCKFAFISKADVKALFQAPNDETYQLMGLSCLSIFRSILSVDKVYSDLKKNITVATSIQ